MESAKDFSKDLHYKRYLYKVYGSSQNALVTISIYFKEEHKKKNSDIVGVEIHQIELLK